ncbi:MAG: hypothetical protein HY587_01130 [Candidatus Omnitrophica bacterium]|nr:hypothetical protein [Candidatus Omnitrophota bacterium]
MSFPRKRESKVADPRLRGDDVLTFLNDTAAQHRLHVDYLASVENVPIDEYAERILSFYRTTTERDKLFLKLLKREMENRRRHAALLVTGGFHREGVTKGLRKAGVSYAVIFPISMKSHLTISISISCVDKPNFFISQVEIR